MRFLAALICLCFVSSAFAETCTDGGLSAAKALDAYVSESKLHNLQELDAVAKKNVIVFMENVKIFQARAGRGCSSSLHCPGGSTCLSGRCTGASRGGSECSSSLHCRSGSTCLDGRCTAGGSDDRRDRDDDSGRDKPGRGGDRDRRDRDASECTSSLHCPGGSLCLSGSCTGSGSSGGSCSSSLHCPGGSLCMGGQCT